MKIMYGLFTGVLLAAVFVIFSQIINLWARVLG